MRVRAWVACAGGAVLAAGLVPSLARASEPGELLVVFETGSDAVHQEAHEEAGAEPTDEIEQLNLDVVEVDDVASAIDAYEDMPDVRYVELNHEVRAAGVPNDPLWPYQWNLQTRGGANRGSANVQPAWDRGVDGGGVVVAVVDTGVRRGGDDLDGGRLLGGWDFVNDDGDPYDDHGHGTHIAGTVAQTTGNAHGVAGVAPQALILPVKVLNSVGSGTYAEVIEGLLWAVDRGATVVNMSLSGSTYSQALCDAVATAAARATVVAAAGNGFGAGVGYPAACGAALAVGAVRYEGVRAAYSNVGASLDLVAPGGSLGQDQNGDGYGDGILQQTYSGGWSFLFFEGTSMAAAHVSGVAALVRQANPGADVANVLRSTAFDLGAAGHDTSYGYGLVDALAAVQAVAAPPLSGNSGYWIVDTGGGVHAFGNAAHYGDVPGLRSAGHPIGPVPVAGLARSATGQGYWVLDKGGGIFGFGDARYFGSIPGLRLAGHAIGPADVIGLASTPSGNGYWILDSKGGMFAFGDAPYFGSIPGLRLAGHAIGPAAVVAMAPTPSGNGYWLLDDQGGMFAFGDARYFGSVPGLRAAGHSIGPARIVTMAPTSTGNGYWLLDDQGGMFAFGDAQYLGSVPALRAAGRTSASERIVGMAATGSGGGYWMVDTKGGVFAFGDAGYAGSLPQRGVTAAVAGFSARV